MADDDAADEFDEAGDPPEDIVEDIVDEELDDELDGDLVDDEALAGDAVVVADDDDEDEDDTATDGRPARPVTSGDDDEDEVDPDDVEADLDTILKDRIAANDDEDDDEEEEAANTGRGADDTGDGANRVAPRKAGEFVCSSCFLVKPNAQLADAKNTLCLDCV